ncbi:MAG TPA: nuclear transport factor 2 family protein [Steroidobacteraceae bacterium]|nr:nuclear transport factor 2 family protein [Steroidobacteraceae bacterium]
MNIRNALRAACLAIGTCALAGTALAQQASAPPPLSPELQAKLASGYERLQLIAARAARVSDIDQLRNLQAAYGYYTDKALWDEVVDLFTDDGTMELGLNGVYVGKNSIRKYLYSLTGGKPGLPPNTLNNHFQLSPVITLAPDGRSAKARWRAIIQGGVYGKGSGGDWGDGIYENEYVKQGGVWKIRSLHFYVKFYAPYEGGWTKAPAASALRYGKSNVRPDRPTSVKYQPYPAHFTPPFHYENPVKTSYVFGGTPPPGSDSVIETTPPKIVADLESQVRALELQVDRLQSAVDVENLNAAYGYYVDKSMQDAISALFADDATLEILGRGVFIGRDRIYEYMRRLGAPQPGSLFNHMQLQPFITISADGTTAQMRTRLFVMFGATGRAAQWGEGIYENTFVKDHGVWKYKNLHGYQTYYTNYDAGWAKQSAGMFDPFPGYPPDMPQSVAYDPYPAQFIPPFHYRHPVTGKIR